jgi:hypothetical protein
MIFSEIPRTGANAERVFGQKKTELDFFKGKSPMYFLTSNFTLV